MPQRRGGLPSSICASGAGPCGYPATEPLEQWLMGEPMSSGTTVLRFDDLDRYLLLKNGNYLYKVPFRDRWAVLKVYYGSRSRLGYAYKTFVHVCFENHTSLMPKARRRVEAECLELWRSCGFRVFGTYDDVTVEGLPEGGYTLFEYVPGTRFQEYFAEPTHSLDDKLAMWRRFLDEWHRRHRMAIERREPRLAHENGSLEHVLIHGDELVYFDFEMAFRSRRRVKEFVAREILAFLKSLGRCVGSEQWDALLEETVRSYASRELLEYTHRFACRNPNPFWRLANQLGPLLKPVEKRPFARYHVGRRLGSVLNPARPPSLPAGLPGSRPPGG